MFRIITNFILDILFPVHCLYCQKYGQWICAQCAKKINILENQVCPYCEKNISPAGRICHFCKNKFIGKKEIWSLDALTVATTYRKSGISHSIYCFKYNFIESLGVPLAKIITKALLSNDLPLPDLIIPIPLHPRRLRWRGFNQAEVLSHHISQNLTPGFSIPFLNDLLIRKKYNKAQMKIKNYQERQKNIQGIFALNENVETQDLASLQGKKILLIDDVSTTGATLFEAGRILKLAGAKKVYGAVIARQEICKK
jgi:ComF family protein